MAEHTSRTGWRETGRRRRGFCLGVTLCGAVAVGVAAGFSAVQLNPRLPGPPVAGPPASAPSRTTSGVPRVASGHSRRGPLDLTCCGLRALRLSSQPTSVTIAARSSIQKLDYLKLLSRIQSVRGRRLVVRVVTNNGKLIMRAEVVRSGRLSAWVAPRLLQR
jgi:hypothetical protein